MGDSIGKSATCKPQKPYADFPPYPYNSKRWAKKIDGKTVCFGSWDDPNGALAKFEAYVSVGRQVETKTAPTATKPPKPYPDFPLYAHNTKRWAKKIKGEPSSLATGAIGRPPWSDSNTKTNISATRQDSTPAERRCVDRGRFGEHVP